MEAKRQAYWWWFDSHNTPRYSPWLRSTLAELDEKTKAMLKLIEEDADSFAQRAEMYYKKRPELISMVEDFYRAYRSLAERYDQQKMDPVTRVRSPLRHSMPDFKAEFGLKSIKSFDSFTEEAYNSSEEESAESEVDDPEHDHGMVVVGDEHEIENLFKGEPSCDELMKLRKEVDRLREENEIQRNLIKQAEKVAEKMKNEMESLKLEKMNLKEQMEKKKQETIETAKECEEAKFELMKTRLEREAENEIQRNLIKQAEKEAEKMKNEMESLKLERMNLKEQMEKKKQETIEMAKECEEAKFELMKTREEREAKFELMKTRLEREAENRYLQEALAEKDEEKREVIRQLSLAMDMLREENRLLKKSMIKKDIPKKQGCPEFQILKGFGLGNLFGLSPKSPASVVPL